MVYQNFKIVRYFAHFFMADAEILKAASEPEAF
jgi:hypothetical protein